MLHEQYNIKKNTLEQSSAILLCSVLHYITTYTQEAFFPWKLPICNLDQKQKQQKRADMKLKTLSKKKKKITEVHLVPFRLNHI